VRQHLVAPFVVAALAAGMSIAAADRTKPVAANAKPAPIDAKAIGDKLDVFHDDFGSYYVSPRPGTFPAEDTEKWVFYGDGKTMYRQAVIGFGVSNQHDYEWMVWSPRVRGLQNARIQLTKGMLYVECKQKDGRRPLTQLTAAEATAFFAQATFLPQLWQREAHFLARDEDGVYFYVDAIKQDFGGNGFRVFVGQKGSMRELAMTNVVSDTAGEIFATKTGELKIITTGDHKAYWKKGSKKAELVTLELWPNRYLIYRELGIYGQLGVVCEDQ
jgi:hypothetical protein